MLAALPPLTDKQGIALLAQGNELLFGGAAGGGKSHLMRIIAVVTACMVPDCQVYLFRRKFSDLYANHMDGPSGFYSLLRPLIEAKRVKINSSSNEILFWNGAKIHLCHCQHEKDMVNYQGAEIHLLLMDELTHFTEKIYRFLRNRVRLGALKVPKAYQQVIPRGLPAIFCGSNPGSVGHNWVRRTFVKFYERTHSLAPRRQTKEEGGMLRQYIPAKLSDNPIMAITDPNYADRLSGLGSPELVKAMLDGDWNIVAGGVFDDLWQPSVHVLPRFRIPTSWSIDRSFDWGSTHPFSVGWWAYSDGQVPARVPKPDGTTYEFLPPKGSMIRLYEWYGTDEIGTNKGLRLGSSEIALTIKEIEASLLESEWIRCTPEAGPADNQIRNVIDGQSDSIEKKMADQGVYWLESDKKPGSRVNGVQLARDRMRDNMLYVMDCCKASIEIIPTLSRDDNNVEDVDPEQEDHIWDEWRYAVLNSANRISTELKVGW